MVEMIPVETNNNKKKMGFMVFVHDILLMFQLVIRHLFNHRIGILYSLVNEIRKYISSSEKKIGKDLICLTSFYSILTLEQGFSKSGNLQWLWPHQWRFWHQLPRSTSAALFWFSLAEILTSNSLGTQLFFLGCNQDNVGGSNFITKKNLLGSTRKGN